MTDTVDVPVADPVDAIDGMVRARPGDSRPSLPLAGGWASQLLVLVMLFVTGMAIHDLRPDGFDDWVGATAWLPLLMVAAGLTGGVLSATRSRAGWVDLVAAIVGTIVCLVVVASVVADAGSITDRLRLLERSVGTALDDLLVERVPSAEVSPFLLILAALAWTTGAYAAISVGRYARATGAIVPIGLMLLVPVVIADVRDQDGGQLLWLTIGVVAALLLVLRLNLERQRVRWLRRHVTGGRAVGRSFLGGGAVLVSVVTSAAVVMTGLMGSSPLQAGWDRLGGVLGDLGIEVGQLREPTTSAPGEFPATMRLQDRWQPRDVTFFTASTESGSHYWRGATYDRFDGRTWRRGDGVGTNVDANDDLLGLTADVASLAGDGFRDVEATITVQDMAGRDLPAPQNPFEVDLSTTLWTQGAAEGPFQVLESRDDLRRGDTFSVLASEPDLDPSSPTSLTEAMLATLADEPAPDWIEGYLQLPAQGPGRMTERTAATIARSLPRRDRDDRYQLARAVQRFLTSARFGYSTEFGQDCAPGQSITDCLLDTRSGFCQQYATTMAVLLRQLGVPTRWVVGYLPGEEVGPGRYEVTGNAAHAWVEVWFDGFGWLRFDPTPGTSEAASALAANGQQQTDLPEGVRSPDETFDPNETLGPDETLAPDETLEPDATVEPSPEPSASPVLAPVDGGGLVIPPGELLVGGGAVALAAIAMLALLWFRRLPGGGAERAWRGITGLAGRFGRGPSPSQTPYEYSVTLSRVVPRVAGDLRTIADAKVASSYGPEGSAGSSPASLRGAYARVRTGLLALVFRRR